MIDELDLYQLIGDPYWVWRTDVPCPTPEIDCGDCQDCFNEGESIVRPKEVDNE